MVAFGEVGLAALALLGDLLLIWAILATIGIAFMFWKLPDLVYGVIDQILTDRGFPKSRSSGGRPKEGIEGQIIGAIADKFLNPATPPQAAGIAPPEPAAPYYPAR